MGEFLNFKFCPSPNSGPLIISGSKTKGKDVSTPQNAPLDSPSSLGDRPSGPTSFGSSAGHTPYPNRLVSLARELRRRPSRSLNPILPENSGLRLPRQPSTSSPGSCPLGETLRQEKELMDDSDSNEDREMAETVVEEHGIYQEKGQQPPENLNRSGEVDGFGKIDNDVNLAQTEKRCLEGQEGTVPSEI